MKQECLEVVSLYGRSLIVIWKKVDTLDFLYLKVLRNGAGLKMSQQSHCMLDSLAWLFKEITMLCMERGDLD